MQKLAPKKKLIVLLWLFLSYIKKRKKKARQGSEEFVLKALGKEYEIHTKDLLRGIKRKENSIKRLNDRIDKNNNLLEKVESGLLDDLNKELKKANDALNGALGPMYAYINDTKFRLRNHNFTHAIKKGIKKDKNYTDRELRRKKKYLSEYKKDLKNLEVQFRSFKILLEADDFLEELSTLDGYEKFVVEKAEHSNYQMLVGITDNIFIDFEKKRYDMGQFRVQLMISPNYNKYLKVAPYANNQIVSMDRHGRERMIHCHVFPSRKVCKGTYRRPLDKAMETGDMRNLFMLMRMHLGSFNPKSTTCDLRKYFKGTEIEE